MWMKKAHTIASEADCRRTLPRSHLTLSKLLSYTKGKPSTQVGTTRDNQERGFTEC